MPAATKIIFLDIDGVVNNNRNIFTASNMPYAGGCAPEDLDVTGVRIINKIARLTGAAVVLMSSWAIGCDMEKLRDLSNKIGINFYSFVPDHLHYPGQTRASMVQIWLEVNPEVTHYAIVDDEPGSHEEIHAEHLVLIDEDNGICANDIDRIGELLDVCIWSLASQEKQDQHKKGNNGHSTHS